MSRSQIEAELTEEFDLEQLAVYADLLQAEGDPRGELIALDLAESDADREPLLRQWLGDALAPVVGVDYGFITGIRLDEPAQLDALLARPAAHYVRGASITGRCDWVESAALRLTEQSGRWLTQLALRVEGTGMISNDPAQQIFEAAPHLERLEVWGEGVFGEVGHPRVKALRVTGAEAIRSMLFTGPARFPSVIALDFAFASYDFDPNRTFMERLPALRRLDLSSNEPGEVAPHHLGGYADVLDVLAQQPARTRLTHLRLPSIRSSDAARALARLLDELPQLREVAVVRAYRQFPTVFLPERVKAPEERWPWPPPDRAHLQVDVRYGHRDVPLAPLIVWLEATWEDLAKHPRAAWRRLFGSLDAEDEGEVAVSSELWREVLATLDDDDTLGPWRELRDQFERGFVDVRVQLTRSS